ncbi:MAG: hypothetical protein U1F43_31425 [Myxococcota bacterium]
MHTTHTSSLGARRSTSTRAGLALGIALSLGGFAACSDDSSPKTAPMTAEDYDQVATTMGALVADESRGEPNAFGGAVELAHGIVPASFQISGNVVIGNLLGLDYNFSVACRDASSAEVACGDQATSATVAVSWSGSWTSTHADASSDFDGHWSLTGLDQDLVTLDGSADASASIAAHHEGSADTTWDLDYTATYDHVGIDADSRRAVSGSVSYALEIERGYPAQSGTVQRHFSVDGEVSFQADGTATLVLDNDQVYRMKRDGSVELVARGSLE